MQLNFQEISIDTLITNPIFYKIVNISMQFSKLINNTYDPTKLSLVYNNLKSILNVNTSNSSRDLVKHNNDLYDLYKCIDLDVNIYGPYIELCKLTNTNYLNIVSDVFIIVQIMVDTIKQNKLKSSDLVKLFINLLYIIYNDIDKISPETVQQFEKLENKT